MKLLQFLSLAVVVLLASSQTGCNLAPKSVGEEKSSMLKGTQTVLNSDPVTITAAAREVADELKLTVEKNVCSGLDGKLIAKSANRMKLVVTTKAHSPGGTLVTVRAGGFGDQGVQKQVLERIKAKLPETASAPAAQPVAQQPVAQAPKSQPMQKMQPVESTPSQAQTDPAQLPF
jgi:hypothetical protein